ncbi:MAG TPA: hypothetical protein ACFYEK_01340 [Candidatus Wunengus sp. YC60]|uniref:hypothetical protein n=1 Tax=Candidatus Wunengus sp. YC60 TaxID=3367697 RepID=UPI004029A6A4
MEKKLDKYATIRSLDDAEVKKLFTHVLKEALGADPSKDDKGDIKDLRDVIEAAGAEVELTIRYNKAETIEQEEF